MAAVIDVWKAHPNVSKAGGTTVQRLRIALRWDSVCSMVDDCLPFNKHGAPTSDPPFRGVRVPCSISRVNTRGRSDAAFRDIKSAEAGGLS
jgi:hypothetical protein